MKFNCLFWSILFMIGRNKNRKSEREPAVSFVERFPLPYVKHRRGMVIFVLKSMQTFPYVFGWYAFYVDLLFSESQTPPYKYL